MNISRTTVACSVVVCLAGLSTARAGETITAGAISRTGGSCERLGPDFVDLGNGGCARIARHVRIYVRPLGSPGQALVQGWAGTTSSAALRSDEPSMVPGAEVTQHLRVHGSLDSYNPYR